jgi:hypothetical protein
VTLPFPITNPGPFRPSPTSNPYAIGSFHYRAWDRLVSMRSNQGLTGRELQDLLDEVGIVHDELVAAAVEDATDEINAEMVYMQDKLEAALDEISTAIDIAFDQHVDKIAQDVANALRAEIGL